jgi:signal transduction histidine kinase
MQMHEADEIHTLRRTMRDLVALSTLPAVWTGYGPDGVAQSLADVLLSMLALDLIYIQVQGPAETDTLVVVRAKDQPDAADRAPVVREALASWLQADPSSPLPAFANPFGTGMLQLAIIRFGDTGDAAALVAGSQRPDFPTTMERLLLSVGANQTAIVIQRKWAEEARTQLLIAEQAARAEAEQAVRIRDQFLSIAAHDLKNPLTTLAGNAQLLQRRTLHDQTLNERDQRTLGVIINQASRLQHLIDALFDISRLQSGHLTLATVSVDLCALLQQLVVDTKVLLEEHDIEFISADPMVLISGEELRLEQVFQNLVANAIKYSPAGGRITVQVARSETHACVTIRDQGIGIPLEVQRHLFEPFYRADTTETQQISGMGIGLYVVKEIVALHDGSVEVESTEGVGSTFTVYLPLYDNSAPTHD